MLTDLMARYGFTRYQTATQAGVSTRAVARWQEGAVPSVTSAVKVARIFGADGQGLLEYWGYPEVELDQATELPVLELILAEQRTTNALLRRLDGFLRHANREQGEHDDE